MLWHALWAWWRCSRRPVEALVEKPRRRVSLLRTGWLEKQFSLDLVLWKRCGVVPTQISVTLYQIVRAVLGQEEVVLPSLLQLVAFESSFPKLSHCWGSSSAKSSWSKSFSIVFQVFSDSINCGLDPPIKFQNESLLHTWDSSIVPQKVVIVAQHVSNQFQIVCQNCYLQKCN